MPRPLDGASVRKVIKRAATSVNFRGYKTGVAHAHRSKRAGTVDGLVEAMRLVGLSGEESKAELVKRKAAQHRLQSDGGCAAPRRRGLLEMVHN